jgi:hypothetical protein
MKRWYLGLLILCFAMATGSAQALAPAPVWDTESITSWQCSHGVCSWVTEYTILGVKMFAGAPGEVQNLYFTEFKENGDILYQTLLAQVTTPAAGSGCAQPSGDYCSGPEPNGACVAQGACSRNEYCFHNGVLSPVTLYGWCVNGCLSPDPYPGPNDPWCPCGNLYCTCEYLISCEQWIDGTFPNLPRIRSLDQRRASISNCPGGAVRADTSCDLDQDEVQDDNEDPRCNPGLPCSIDFGE